MPEWRVRPHKSIKQGSGDKLGPINSDSVDKYYRQIINLSLRRYNDLLDLGVAPEQARMVLPQSMYTEFIDTGSLVYWARMYRQRSESTAQSEWAPLMVELNEIMQELYPVSWEALTGGHT
jgi:thymidylate synthase (FAD)